MLRRNKSRWCKSWAVLRENSSQELLGKTMLYYKHSREELTGIQGRADWDIYIGLLGWSYLKPKAFSQKPSNLQFSGLTCIWTLYNALQHMQGTFAGAGSADLGKHSRQDYGILRRSDHNIHVSRAVPFFWSHSFSLPRDLQIAWVTLILHALGPSVV